MLAAPLPDNEVQRLATLHELGLLDSLPEESYDALAQAAATALGCAMATVTLVDARRQWFKAVHGLAFRETPRAISFCAHAILGSTLFEVPDTSADARFHDNPLVTDAPGVRFYAGVPLRVDGVMLGTLAVLDTQPRRLDERQQGTLQGLARVAVELLQARRRLVALHDERVRLHDLARASGDWMWETDESLHYRWISGQFEPVTGLPPSALLGRRVEDAPLVDASPAELAAGTGFVALLQRQAPFSRVVTPKQTPRGRLLISRSAMPIVDALGRFRGYRGTARDVTVQLEAQRLAADRAELLHKLSSQIPGLIFQHVRHADGRSEFPYLSKGVETVFGVSAEKVKADPARAFRIVHAEDRDRVFAGIAESAQTLGLWHAEYRVIREDGALRWLETRASPERLPDGGTRWHAFSADVTERKQTELALRRGEDRWELAASAIGLGLAEFERAGRRLVLDERACRNHGLPYPTTLDFDAWLDALHPDDRAGAALAVQEAMTGGSGLQGRYRVRLPGGGERVLDFVGRAIVDADGVATGLLATCRDVTETAEHERLRQDKENAERASRAKSEFLSRMSHELRTPLNGILGFAQLMALDRHAPLAPDQRRRLDSVLHAGQHLLDLINDVLDLARIEQQDLALRPEPIDADAVLHRCLDLIAPLAADMQVQLPAAPGQPCWVAADRRALEQVLMNLLSNAIKYNRRGGTVRAQLDRCGEQILIALSDDGPGLTQAQQARLFQHFERLGAEAGPVQGSGLGLVIARQLAHAMGGELRLRSLAGSGSTFTLVLPACAAPECAAPASALPDATTMPGPLPDGALAPRQVLYIEDEPLNVVLMEEIFRTRPAWTLHTAAHGAAGLTLAASLQPDLVIADMNLPDMNGSTLVRTLRRNPATQALRCIALSADAMAQQIAAARAAGFDDYWTKPIDLLQMLAELDRVLA